jgi:hypothetical protein
MPSVRARLVRHDIGTVKDKSKFLKSQISKMHIIDIHLMCIHVMGTVVGLHGHSPLRPERYELSSFLASNRNNNLHDDFPPGVSLLPTVPCPIAPSLHALALRTALVAHPFTVYIS